MSCIYFVQAGPSGPIKIGWTAGNPIARMASLQTGNPEPLRLLAKSSGSLDDEKALHARFAGSRMTGEWFRPEPALLGFVAGVNWIHRAEHVEAPHPEPDGLDEIFEYVEARRIELEAEEGIQEIDCADAHEASIGLAARDHLQRVVARGNSLAADGGPGVDLNGRERLGDTIATLERGLQRQAGHR